MKIVGVKVKRKIELAFGLMAVFVLSVSPVFAADPSVKRRVPHYFPDGIENVQDTAKQREAYLRYLNATSACTNVGENTYYREFHNSLRVERTIEGEKVLFIFDPWTRTQDGRIVFYNFCGQQYVSQSDFDFVVEDFVNESTRAMDADFDYYKDFEKRAVQARAKYVGMSEVDLRAILDKPVKENPKVTYRELLGLPNKSKKSDFIPREVHIGYFSALGEAWLNSGVVWTSIQSRLKDYLTGKPAVMMHEFIHANPNMQNVPLSGGVDLELIASVPDMFFPEVKTDFPFHSYMRDVREWVHVYFGFNFKQARDEYILFDHDGNLRIDAAKLNEHIDKLEKVKAELWTFFRDVAIPEFYSDTVKWKSLHDKLQDSRGVFKVMLALHYDPTVLDGHNKTMLWLKAHESDIKRMGEAAYNESGEPLDDQGDENMTYFGMSVKTISNLGRMFGINREEALRLAAKYHITVEDLKNKSFNEVMSLVSSIMGKENQERRVQ